MEEQTTIFTIVIALAQKLLATVFSDFSESIELRYASRGIILTSTVPTPYCSLKSV